MFGAKGSSGTQHRDDGIDIHTAAGEGISISMDSMVAMTSMPTMVFCLSVPLCPGSKVEKTPFCQMHGELRDEMSLVAP